MLNRHLNNVNSKTDIMLIYNCFQIIPCCIDYLINFLLRLLNNSVNHGSIFSDTSTGAVKI